MDRKVYDTYVAILKHELVPALGCTEPIAIAYAAAKARDVLGKFPEHITAYCSGNIIKNVKGVVVPKSKGMRGIEAAATLGAVGGNAELEFEVLEPVTENDIARAKQLIAEGFCTCRFVEGRDNLYIRIEAVAGTESSIIEIEHEHTNITSISKNGTVIFKKDNKPEKASISAEVDKSTLNVRDIIEFANIVNLDDVRDLLKRQVELNTAISKEGLAKGYGSGIGRLLYEMNGESLQWRAISMAAAGSDARMNGCPMPVVINSGSGNQGITITLPVYEYAKTLNKTEDEMYRALVIGNLISVHIKRHIGNLSAFCGATNAACGAACAIGYMYGYSYEQICMTITNTLCNIGGMVCDGAKSSCAAKIASALNAGILGFEMAGKNKTFCAGEGLVGKSIEETIENIGRVGREGMRSTDSEILNIMVGN